jgi:hypothetical protein
MKYGITTWWTRKFPRLEGRKQNFFEALKCTERGLEKICKYYYGNIL